MASPQHAGAVAAMLAQRPVVYDGLMRFPKALLRGKLKVLPAPTSFRIRPPVRPHRYSHAIH